MKKTSGWLWGGLLIVAGCLWLLKSVGVLDVDIFFPGWWTLFIIVPCFVSFLTEKDKMGSVIGMLIGAALLLGCLGVMSFGMIWKLALPIILILIGISVIVGNSKKSGIEEKIAAVNKKSTAADNKREFCAAFSGQDVNFAGKEFKGCRADALFGGIKIDLREAKLKEDAVLKASCYFGGVDILVPEDWNVEVAATSVFGGVEDKRKIAETKDKKKPTLYISATCVFGGANVK